MPDLLRASDLTVRFGGLTAVDGVSLSVDAGQVTALIGPNGAGKTTCFDALTGFVRPDGGQVLFEGSDVTRLPPHMRTRLGMARTFQTERPFEELSVLRNVLVSAFLRHPARADAEQVALEVLSRVGLQDRAEQPASDLNLARRRRLEVAKALALEPRILFLDEVMAGLNPPALAEMIAFLKILSRQGIAIVLVEHILEAVMQLADHVIVLASGKIIAEGRPDVVTADPAVIEAYLGTE